LIFSPVFYYFIRPEGEIYFPGAPYALASIFLVIALVLASLAMRSLQPETD